MAKRKDSIALFEVIKSKRNEASLNVPKWMGGQGSAGVQEPPAEPPMPAPAPAARAEESAASGGGKVTLRLTGTHLALAGTAALLVIIVSVWIGYAMKGSSGTGPASANGGGAMRNQVPQGKHVLPTKSGGQGGGTPTAGGSKAPAAASKRIDGKYYLVIQAIPGGGRSQAAEAKKIAAWCSKNGEPATVATFTQRSTGKKWSIVWSLRPFDSPTSDAALAYGHQIETLGKKYMAEYKRYDFRQKNNGKFDPWYLPYKG